LKGACVPQSSNLFVPDDPQQAPALRGSRCDACATVVFPKMPVCPACRRNGTMQEARIGRAGTLFSHTIARFAPKGFTAPYFQVFVDLDEGPRIFALVGADCPVEDGVLADGMAMRLVVEPLADTPENRDILTYKYVPAAPGASRRPEGEAPHA
jgi:uncharacterized OB-fold protein